MTEADKKEYLPRINFSNKFSCCS